MPISWLPLSILYLISDLIYLLLYRAFAYRKTVVRENLTKSFPEKSLDEIKEIEKAFYKHLADIFVEGLKVISIRKNNLLKRYRCINPELITPYFQEPKSLILVSAHYNNWEYMVASLGLQFDFHGVGVGKRMSDKAFESFMHERRTRYGTEVCYNDNTTETFENNLGRPTVYMLLADQNPNDENKSYWLSFLNQDTATIYGPEYLAKKYDFPVFYYTVNKVRRGYYEFELSLIENNPQASKYGDITESHFKTLENNIIRRPEFWLWSHRRWKFKRKNNN